MRRRILATAMVSGTLAGAQLAFAHFWLSAILSGLVALMLPFREPLWKARSPAKRKGEPLHEIAFAPPPPRGRPERTAARRALASRV